MPVIIPDETLRAAKLSEREARLEIACWMFDKEKLDLWPAAQFAGMTRDEFVGELQKRCIPVYRYDEDDFALDLKALGVMDMKRDAGRQ